MNKNFLKMVIISSLSLLFFIFPASNVKAMPILDDSPAPEDAFASHAHVLKASECLNNVERYLFKGDSSQGAWGHEEYDQACLEYDLTCAWGELVLARTLDSPVTVAGAEYVLPLILREEFRLNLFSGFSRKNEGDRLKENGKLEEARREFTDAQKFFTEALDITYQLDLKDERVRIYAQMAGVSKGLGFSSASEIWQKLNHDHLKDAFIILGPGLHGM